MRASRRSFLKAAALGAGAAVAAPYMFVRNIDQAWGAQSWIKKGEPIKVGLLFSLSGGLAVPEEDSTLVMQYAIDEINNRPVQNNYAKIIAIIQSSGTGKSKTVDEIAKTRVLFPLCLREEIGEKYFHR